MSVWFVLSPLRMWSLRMTLPPAILIAVLKLLMCWPPAESVEGPPAEHQSAAEGQLSRRVQEAVRRSRRAPRRLHVDPAQGARPAGLQGRPLHPHRPQPQPGSVSVIPSIPSAESPQGLLSAVSEFWHTGSWPSRTLRVGVLVKEGCLSWVAVSASRLTLSLLRRAPTQAPAQEPGGAAGRGREERRGQGRLRRDDRRRLGHGWQAAQRCGGRQVWHAAPSWALTPSMPTCGECLWERLKCPWNPPQQASLLTNQAGSAGHAPAYLQTESLWPTAAKLCYDAAVALSSMPCALCCNLPGCLGCQLWGVLIKWCWRQVWHWHLSRCQGRHVVMQQATAQHMQQRHKSTSSTTCAITDWVHRQLHASHVCMGIRAGHQQCCLLQQNDSWAA